MKPEEIRDEFERELKDLLKKYKAEMLVDDLTHNEDARIIVEFEYNMDESFFKEHNTGTIPELIIGRYLNYERD